MSPEAHVAQLQDLLERVQRNRLRLAELRGSGAVEAPDRDAPPAVEAAAQPVPEQPAIAPVLAAPVLPLPVLPAPAEPAAAKIEPPAPVFIALQPVEPEPELVPLPDEPGIAASEPFEEVTKTSPIPLVAAAPARQPDLAPRGFEGAVVASGPVAEVSGTRVVQRSWSLDAVLFRAWRLGRDGGSR